MKYVEFPRTYERTIIFVLVQAVEELFPRARIQIAHSYENGLYAELSIGRPVNRADLCRIQTRMQEIVQSREAISEKALTREEARRLFQHRHAHDKIRLLRYLPRRTLAVFSCGRTIDHFPGPLYPNTSPVSCFGLRALPPGFILRFRESPTTSSASGGLPRFREQPRLFQVFQEYEHWGRVLGLDDLGSLNQVIAQGKVSDTVKIAEALHEKKIAVIADAIASCRDRVRLVLISGPSASGKTTFSKRLTVQLRVNGLRPIPISLDNYFRPRRATPRTDSGAPDFECLEALDITLLNRHLTALLAGRQVHLPRFDFRTGYRARGRRLALRTDDILLLEGIHALNPDLTPAISHRSKFKLYVSALTHLNLDDHNRIPTSETRLLRRMVRDSLFRGHAARETLIQWSRVREGEERNVFPFQEEADTMFNSALVFELGVLKKHALPLLAKVSRSTPEYPQAALLRNLLSYFRSVDDREVPRNSILREFIGHSSFEY